MSPRDEVPPHRQVAAIIEHAIRTGDLLPGQPLPSEADLMGETGLGRNTVRRAVKVLRDAGLIYTVATRGSYVSRDIPPG
jgi:DNA-binding GntR family transcriptional regulator